MSEQDTVQLFDRHAEWPVTILSGGERSCRVKYPSDSDWCKLARASRVTQKMLRAPGGESEIEAHPDLDTFHSVFQRIHCSGNGDGGPAFNEPEAKGVIDALDRSEVVAVERTANDYEARIKVPHIKEANRLVQRSVFHVLRMPTMQERLTFDRGQPPAVVGKGFYRTRVAIEPSIRLYDEIHVSHRGYATDALADIPANHKDDAVRAVLNAMAETAPGVEDDDPEP